MRSQQWRYSSHSGCFCIAVFLRDVSYDPSTSGPFLLLQIAVSFLARPVVTERERLNEALDKLFAQPPLARSARQPPSGVCLCSQNAQHMRYLFFKVLLREPSSHGQLREQGNIGKGTCRKHPEEFIRAPNSIDRILLSFFPMRMSSATFVLFTHW